MHYVSVEGLTKSFGIKPLFKNISFHIEEGDKVSLVAKNGSGKSTLLNALLNEDRAIVSDIPGTTRDTIEEVINIDGILFRLIDTAGIRSHSIDSIEIIGMQRSLDKMKQSDLVLYLFEAGKN